MARCPHCNKVLTDSWITKEGASIMGRAGGKNKRRATAREAAMTRWKKRNKKE